MIASSWSFLYFAANSGDCSSNSFIVILFFKSFLYALVPFSTSIQRKRTNSSTISHWFSLVTFLAMSKADCDIKKSSAKSALLNVSLRYLAGICNTACALSIIQLNNKFTFSSSQVIGCPTNCWKAISYTRLSAVISIRNLFHLVHQKRVNFQALATALIFSNAAIHLDTNNVSHITGSNWGALSKNQLPTHLALPNVFSNPEASSWNS